MRLVLLIIFFNSAYADFRKVETIREYVYDFSVSGGASNTFLDISQATTGSTQLPLGIVVESVDLKVITPLISTSMDTSITIGNSTSSTGYFLAKPISTYVDNYTTVGDGGLIFDNTTKLRKSNYISDTNDRNLGLTISAGTSLSAGKILFKIKSFLYSED